MAIERLRASTPAGVAVNVRHASGGIAESGEVEDAILSRAPIHKLIVDRGDWREILLLHAIEDLARQAAA